MPRLDLITDKGLTSKRHHIGGFNTEMLGQHNSVHTEHAAFVGFNVTPVSVAKL